VIRRRVAERAADVRERHATALCAAGNRVVAAPASFVTLNRWSARCGILVTAAPDCSKPQGDECDSHVFQSDSFVAATCLSAASGRLITCNGLAAFAAGADLCTGLKPGCLQPADAGRLRGELLDLARSWRQVLADDPMPARPIVSVLLDGRATFEPDDRSHALEDARESNAVRVVVQSRNPSSDGVPNGNGHSVASALSWVDASCRVRHQAASVRAS